MNNSLNSNNLCPDKSSTSRVNCFDSDATNKICTFQNAMIDFSRVHTIYRPGSSNSRQFDKGFLSVDCGAQGQNIPDYWPGYSPKLQIDKDTTTCDYVFPETVILYSHDELRNIGHTIQDLMNTWLMTVLAGQSDNTKDITLLNVDALRLYNNESFLSTSRINVLKDSQRIRLLWTKVMFQTINDAT